MRILFVNTLYYPNQLGGAEVSVQLLCEALYKQGNQVYVLSLAGKRGVRRLNGVVTIYVPYKNVYAVTKPDDRPWKKMLWHIIDTLNVAYYFLIRRLLSRIQPDIVNTNNMQGFSLFAWRLLKRRGTVLIHTMRDYYILCHRTTLYKNGCQCNRLCWSCSASFAIKKRYCKLPDAYIGISSHIITKHEQFQVVTDQPTWVIPNIVGTPLPGSILKRNAVLSDIRIGFLGRLTSEKGVDFLFREMSRLQQANYTLVLAGAYQPQYKEMLLSQYTLKGNVQFMGKVNAADFFNAVDIVVVPSAWEEPFGRVVIEALSYHKPVCVAAKGGMVDLYEPDCMWQFEMKAGSLASIMEMILQQPEIIAQKALDTSRFLYKYSEAEVTQRFIDAATQVAKMKRNE